MRRNQWVGPALLLASIAGLTGLWAVRRRKKIATPAPLPSSSSAKAASSPKEEQVAAAPSATFFGLRIIQPEGYDAACDAVEYPLAVRSFRRSNSITSHIRLTVEDLGLAEIASSDEYHELCLAALGDKVGELVGAAVLTSSRDTPHGPFANQTNLRFHSISGDFVASCSFASCMRYSVGYSIAQISTSSEDAVPGQMFCLMTSSAEIDTRSRLGRSDSFILPRGDTCEFFPVCDYDWEGCAPVLRAGRCASCHAGPSPTIIKTLARPCFVGVTLSFPLSEVFGCRVSCHDLDDVGLALLLKSSPTATEWDLSCVFRRPELPGEEAAQNPPGTGRIPITAEIEMVWVSSECAPSVAARFASSLHAAGDHSS